MRYSLATLAVDEECLKTIQTRLLASLLQKMGVNKHLPVAIRHGPTRYGGLDLYDLQTEGGLESIKFMRDAIYTDTPAGRLILTNLQYSQLEAGVPEPLLEKPDQYISYLTPTWVTSVRQYLSQHNMTITVNNDGSQVLASGDQHIMQPAHLQRYTHQQQRDINLVRIYLQVYSLTDMTDIANPTRIHLSYLDGKRPDGYEASTLWPNQVPPTASQRRLWKDFLKSSYLRYAPHWLKSPPLKPAKPSSSEESNSSEHISLKTRIKHLSRTERRMVESIEGIIDNSDLVTALTTKKTVTIASDGGLKGSFGTFGWVIAKKSAVLLAGSGPVDGPQDTASSTRCELWGYASALLTLVLISRHQQTKPKCRLKWLVDSKAAISKVRKFIKWGHVKRGRQPQDVDVLSLIKKCYDELGKRVRIRWIKAHQDTDIPHDKLSELAKLNVQADQLATNYRLRGKRKSSPFVDHQSGQRISVSIHGRRLTSQYDSSIRFHVNGYHLRKYIQERRGWDDKTWDQVDFVRFEQHLKRLTPLRQISHMKFIHDQQPLGTRRLQQAMIHDETLSLCPCCTTTIENQAHLLRCRDNQGRIDAWRAFRKVTLTKEDPHPFWHCLVEGIEHWTQHADNNYLPDVTAYPPHLRRALAAAALSQKEIGWENSLRGFLSTEWIHLVSLDMNDQTSCSDDRGNARLRKAISCLYEYTWKTWDSRNELLHTTDSTKLAATIRSADIASIKHYHSKPHLLRFDDRHLCERQLTKLIQGSSSTQRRWLKMVRKSTEAYTQEGKTQMSITSYFERK